MPNHNLALLIDAARLLKPLLSELVFVGGSATSLLITDKGAAEVRPTYDVDAIAEITSYAAYADFSQRLRKLGFTEDTSEGAPICRWRQQKTALDLMPLDEKILGFSNRWYKPAMDSAEEHELKPGLPSMLRGMGLLAAPQTQTAHGQQQQQAQGAQQQGQAAQEQAQQGGRGDTGLRTDYPPADVMDIEGVMQKILSALGIEFVPSPVAGLSADAPGEIPIPSNLIWIKDILNGHGWSDHGQDDFSSKEEYKKLILDTVQNATGNDIQHPSKGRTLFWNDKEGFAVWRNTKNPDRSTAYFPDNANEFKKKWGLE
jgi:hypothetical protein